MTREELLTILSWKPNRLGHVIHVPSDIKNEILKQEIGLELCLSCNVHAKMFEGTFSDHHFGEWRERGGLIALSVCLIVIREEPAVLVPYHHDVSMRYLTLTSLHRLTTSACSEVHCRMSTLS